MHMITENISETLLISKRFLDFKRLDSSDSYTKESLPIINQLIEQFTADHRSAHYFIKGYMLRLFLFLEEPSNYEVINSLAAWKDTCTKNCQMVQILGAEPVMMFLHKRGDV